MILETTFVTDEGEAKIIDFMPSTFRHSSVARIVVGVRGQVPFNMDLAMRFDYGHTVPWVERHGEQTLTAVAGPEMLILRTPVSLKPRAKRTIAQFTVRAGEQIPFALTHQASHEPIIEPFDVNDALQKTDYFWREFSGRCPDVGSWTDLVKRSLITLKALTTCLRVALSQPRRPRCLNRSEGPAIGITGTAGCATPP